MEDPQGRKLQARRPPLQFPKTEEEEEEVSEANPEEENLTGAQPKESPGKTPKQRIQIKIDAGTVERLAIG